ncbi:MAG: family 10 glycosylhydrolase [Elusimicrobia bacterium]|nr:family 10 glycosylhydrolase [Elusimicrobiota bacterium]
MDRKLFFSTVLTLALAAAPAGCEEWIYTAGAAGILPPEISAAKKMAVESRGVWVDKSDLYKGMNFMLSALDSLKNANFNTIYLPVWYKGRVAYPGSAYAPIDPDIEKIDPRMLARLIAAAHERGFMVQAWTEYGFGAYHTTDAAADPSRGAILDKNPELTALDKDGLPYEHIKEWGYFYHLCPANPASHKILAALFTEIVAKLPFDALNLDRIRFPNENFCFCEYCKKKFLEDTGYRLTPDIFSDPQRLAAFRRWRKIQVTDFMAKLREMVKAARPGMPVTAAVWYDSELENKGQDWPAWIKKGYLDLALPMIYWPGNDATINSSAALVKDKKKMAVGISAEICTREELKRQVEYIRSKKLSGAAFWYLSPLLGMTDYLRDTVFQEPALPYAGEKE